MMNWRSDSDMYKSPHSTRKTSWHMIALSIGFDWLSKAQMWVFPTWTAKAQSLHLLVLLFCSSASFPNSNNTNVAWWMRHTVKTKLYCDDIRQGILSNAHVWWHAWPGRIVCDYDTHWLRTSVIHLTCVASFTVWKRGDHVYNDN